MALFKCPECEKIISDKSDCCIGCGLPRNLFFPKTQIQDADEDTGDNTGKNTDEENASFDIDFVYSVEPNKILIKGFNLKEDEDRLIIHIPNYHNGKNVYVESLQNTNLDIYEDCDCDEYRIDYFTTCNMQNTSDFPIFLVSNSMIKDAKETYYFCDKKCENFCERDFNPEEWFCSKEVEIIFGQSIIVDHDNYYVLKEDNKLLLVAYLDNKRDFVIPEKINGYIVNEIYYSAFKQQMKTIYIPITIEKMRKPFLAQQDLTLMCDFPVKPKEFDDRWCLSSVEYYTGEKGIENDEGEIIDVDFVECEECGHKNCNVVWDYKNGSPKMETLDEQIEEAKRWLLEHGDRTHYNFKKSYEYEKYDEPEYYYDYGEYDYSKDYDEDDGDIKYNYSSETKERSGYGYFDCVHDEAKDHGYDEYEDEGEHYGHEELEDNEEHEYNEDNEEKEVERLQEALSCWCKKEEIKESDFKQIDNSAKNILAQERFCAHVSESVKEFYERNKIFTKLPNNARMLFDKAVGLLSLGEFTSMDFDAAFAHYVQRAAEEYLTEITGVNALPVKFDEAKAKLIAEEIKIITSKCITEKPGYSYIVDLLSVKQKYCAELNNLKSCGIQNYIVRSGKWKIPDRILSTWKYKTFDGGAEEFLFAVIDLSNLRNHIVHRAESGWDNDAKTMMLNFFRIIIQSYVDLDKPF